LEAARTLHGLTRDGRVIDIEVSVSSLKTRDGMLLTFNRSSQHFSFPDHNSKYLYSSAV